MEKYYRVSLNCARRRSYCDNHFIEYGYIEIFPIRGSQQKKGFLMTKNIPVITYTGKYEVIAKLVDDHFEDIILNKRIDYDREGVRDIAIATTEDLLIELDNGLTCYHYTEVDPEIARHYAEKIKSDENTFNKYRTELTEIETKTNVLNEITRREQAPLHDEKSLDIKHKQRVRNIKSA